MLPGRDSVLLNRALASLLCLGPWGGQLLMRAAFAEAPATTAAAPAATAAKPFSGSISLTGTSNLSRRGDVDHEAGLGADLSASYKIPRDLTLGASFAFSQNLTGEHSFEVDDGSLSLTHKAFELNEIFKIGSAMRLLIPLSEASHDRSTITALTLAPSINADFTSLGARGLSAGYALSLTRAFHRYDTMATGGSNSAFSLGHAITLDWEVFEIFSFSALFQHTTAWTYEGHIKQAFVASQEASLSPRRDLSFGIGHRNGGDVLKPNGESSNIALFNEQTSVVYATVSYTY